MGTGKLLLVICLLNFFANSDGFLDRWKQKKAEAAAAAEAEAAAEVEEELPGALTAGSADEAAAAIVEDTSEVLEVVCTGDDGTMDASSQSTIDKIIQRVQGKALTKTIIKLITNRLKNPDSGLRRLLGKAAQDPKDPDYDENEAEMSGSVNLGLINVLTKVLGQTRTVIGYLWEFGFLAKVLNKSPVAAENYGGVIPPCAVTNAIKEFQLFNQITPVDGKLTKETRDLMAKDRCGNPDVHCDTPECQAEIAAAEEGTYLHRRKRYSVKTKFWQTAAADGGIILKYYFENMYNPAAEGKTGHDQMDEASVKDEVAKGLATWTRYAKIHFFETDQEADADISIRFGSGQHEEKSESRSFDGPLGVLAHMYYPRSGRMHFDESENFTASPFGPGINLFAVAAHEMGHGLGIEHSDLRAALMYSYYGGFEENILQEDDIYAITDLYEAGVGSLTRLGAEATEPPAEPTLPPAEPTETPCIEKFTAGMSHPTEDLTYLFTGQDYIQLEQNIDGGATPLKDGGYFPKVTEGYPFRIADKWPGLTGPFDGAVTDSDNMISYFFHDRKVSTWDWNSGSVGELLDEPVGNTIFSGLPDGITAVGQYKDYFVFFTANRYYVFSLEDGLLNEEGYPSPESSDDESIAGAFDSFFNGYMYLALDKNPEQYHLVKTKKLVTSKGVGKSTVEKAYKAIVNDYANKQYRAEDGTFDWPADGLTFCSTEILK